MRRGRRVGDPPLCRGGTRLDSRVVEILFLGGTNFLGRHAAAIALERGHDVAVEEWIRAVLEPAGEVEVEHEES